MSRSIFIIDDYSINLKIAELLLKQHGYFDRYTSFLDAEKALSLLISQQNNPDELPDVILLDLSMPGMDGWQFLDAFEKIAASLNKQPEVFILSASVDQQDIQRSKGYTNVKGFFSKPLNPLILHDMATCLASVS